METKPSTAQDFRTMLGTIKYPVISDKATRLLERNKYTFMVDKRANKFTIKKVIEYIKATTQNNNVLYDSYNNGWLGISYLKKSNLNNCYTFKTLEDTPSQQEQNVFKVTVVELNPTIEE